MKEIITSAWGQTPTLRITALFSHLGSDPTRISSVVLSIALAMFSLTSFAQESMTSELLSIQQQWAIVNYKTAKNEQEDAFEDLFIKIDQLALRYPNNSEPKVWQGIIRSTYAGVVGGLSALSYVKDARDFLLKAKKLDDTVLEGSVYTSLGTLYAKVPGWPIAFGDDDKARALLSRAVELNPSGLDPNYFYADFLYEEGEYKKALNYLNLALLAPKRENRALADSRRLEEAELLMEKIRAEI